MQLKTAAVIVPNERFLKGEINLSHDLQHITFSVSSLGYNLKKVSVVEENDRSVASELLLFTKLYDIVIVLANAKPDCVSQALANITSHQFITFKELVDRNADRCTWPKGIKLLKSKGKTFPVIYFHRIFVLQIGIVQDQLEEFLNNYLGHYRKEEFYSKFFDVPSNGFKKYIAAISHDGLNIGFVDGQNNTGKDLLKLSSKNFQSVVRGEAALREKLGSSILSSCWDNEMQEKIYLSEDNHVRLAIEAIENCLEKYGPQNVFLSFNGGKDCTVLLHLVQTVLSKKYPNSKNEIRVFCLYVRSENAFREQDEFIEQCKVFYNLEVMTITSNIMDALGVTLDKKPQLKACFMGTRRTDPFSANSNVFEMTDPDWPQVMRCSPLLDWHYSDIWDYLLFYKVPYCKLYDYGFTSLGNASNTIRNPSLIFSEEGRETYLPAYKMLNEMKERSGRSVSKI